MCVPWLQVGQRGSAGAPDSQGQGVSHLPSQAQSQNTPVRWGITVLKENNSRRKREVIAGHAVATEKILPL